MICASKFDNFMFYMDYDELSKKYSLALYDLYKKTISKLQITNLVYGAEAARSRLLPAVIADQIIWRSAPVPQTSGAAH